MNHCAVGHAGILYGHQSAYRAAGNNKPAHMLGEVAGKALNLLEQAVEVLGHIASGTGFGKLVLQVTTAVPPGQRLAELFNKQWV